MAEFEDKLSPCPCPISIIQLLALAVRYTEAAFPDRPDVILGANHVKTFMEQPAEEWCRYISEGEKTNA